MNCNAEDEFGLGAMTVSICGFAKDVVEEADSPPFLNTWTHRDSTIELQTVTKAKTDPSQQPPVIDPEAKAQPRKRRRLDADVDDNLVGTRSTERGEDDGANEPARKDESVATNRTTAEYLEAFILQYVQSQGGQATSRKIGIRLASCGPSGNTQGVSSALQELKAAYSNLSTFLKQCTSLMKTKLDDPEEDPIAFLVVARDVPRKQMLLLDEQGLSERQHKTAWTSDNEKEGQGKERGVEDSTRSYLEDLVVQYLNSKGGTALSAHVGTFLTSCSAFDTSQCPSALQEIKEKYGCLSSFVQESYRLKSVEDSERGGSKWFYIALKNTTSGANNVRNQQRAGDDSAEGDSAGQNETTSRSFPGRHLKDLIVESVKYHGGSATSNDVGRYLATREGSSASGNSTATQELKNMYGSLSSFVEESPVLRKVELAEGDGEFFVVLDEKR